MHEQYWNIKVVLNQKLQINKKRLLALTFKKIWVVFIVFFLVFQPLSSLTLKAESLVLSDTATVSENVVVSDVSESEALFPTLPELTPDLPDFLPVQNTLETEVTGSTQEDSSAQSKQNENIVLVEPVLPAETGIATTTELQVEAPASTTIASTTFSPEILASTTPTGTAEIIIEIKEATSEQPYEHLNLSNKEIKSILPDDLVNPIVVGVKKLNPALALKLIIQNVNQNISASTATDTITYFDAFPSTDLEYTLTGKTLKENIILKDENHPTSFVYQLNLSQYDYLQTSSSTIELYRKGRNKNPLFKLYTISAPIMTDKNALSSTNVVMTLEGEMLTLTPDEEWLKEAVYPVYVDPTVEVNVLNVYSNPVEGEYWTIDFVTAGQSDLVITPADLATVNDMQFTSLVCDGTEATSTVDSQGVITSQNWICEGLGQVRFYDKKTGHHHMMFAFGGSTADAYNGNNVWLGGVDTNWETNGNWSLGAAPVLADDVVISATSTALNIKLNAATSINSLTIGSLVATSTLSFEYDAIAGSPLTIVGDMNVNSFGFITHKMASYTPDGVGLVEGRIEISVGGNATIASGGQINTYGKGYWYSNGPGMGKGYIDPGGNGYRSSGASHGGMGGFTGAEYMSPAGMIPTTTDIYGDMYAPIELGSGGGSGSTPDSGQWGSFGGGAIKLDVTGTTTIDGIITSDAEGMRNAHRGGGAGGSVYLTTGKLSGSGTVSANGGPFHILSGNTGGGGGGRIAVYYTSDNSTINYENHGGAWVCSFFITGKLDDSRNCPTSGFYGGGMVGGFGMASSTTSSFGGAGTTYKKAVAQSFGDLTLDNNNGLDGSINENLDTQSMELVYEDALGKTPLLADIVLDSLTVKNGAYLFLDTVTASTVSSTVINLQELGALDVATGTTFSYSTLNWASGMIIYGGGNFALLNESQDLVIPSSVPASLYPTTLVMKVPGDTRTYNNVIIGGVLKSAYNRNVSSTTPDSGLYKINWTITGDLTIDFTGSIDQTGRGFSGNQGPGAGMSTTTAPTDPNRFGAGGSYGGIGGATSTFPGINAGSTYGSSTAPTDLGSGGGGVPGASYTGDFYEGGFGGGAVILSVTGTTTLNGLISADGESFPGWSSGNFGYCDFKRGAGSGGSVYLTTGHLNGYGKISSDGGDVCKNGAAAGGGGRIAVYSTSHNDTISLSATGGEYRAGLNRRTASDPNYTIKGSAGTIYPTQPPSAVITNAATGVGNTSATLNGDLTQLGYFDIVDHGFVWSINAIPYLGIETSLATGGTATSSGDPDESFPAGNAFLNTGGWSPYHNNDGFDNPTGTPISPWYLQYDLATATVVNAFYIRGGTPLYGARHYELRGWDGSNWVVLQGDNQINRWDDNPTNYYAYNNTTAYNKYRLYIGSRYTNFTPSSADDGIYIYQLAFYDRRVPHLNLAEGSTAIASSSAMGYDPQNAIYGWSPWAYDSNIATGGTATTSNEQASYPASNAFDNDSSTYWISEHNLAIGGTATGSQENSPASNAFDGDISTSWITSNVYGGSPTTSYPSDLEYDLGTSIVINQYAITVGPCDFGDPPCPDAAPNTWDFQGWNGSSWVTLDSRTGETAWGSSEVRYYVFSNSTGYTKYRLHVISNDGAVYLAVSEMAFYGTAGVTDWIEYDLSQTATATGYSVLYDANSYNASSSPNTWDFEAWNGATWDVLDSVSGVTDWISTTTKTYSFANSTAYDKYRLNISANNGGVSNSIGEVRLFPDTFPQNNFQITLTSPKTVMNYQIFSDPVSYSLPASSTPKSWDFEAWNVASSTWVNLDSVTNNTNWTATSQNFGFVNANSYTDYRFVFTENNGTASDLLFINQIKFSEGVPASGQSTLDEATSTGVYSAVASGLSPNTTYHYRAYLMAHDGNPYYGADQTFTTTGGGNTPPNPPDTLAPTSYVNGSWVNDNTPTLTFNLTDPDGGDTVKYEIQISATSSFSSLLVDYTSALAAQGAFSFTLGQATGTGSYSTGFAGQTLPDSANYYWRAMTYDNSSATSTYTTANSGSIAFRVDTAPPVPGALSFSSVATTTITTDISGESDSLSGLATAPYVFYNTTASTNSGATSSASWLSSGLTAGTMYSFVAAVTDVAGNTATTVPASTTTLGSISVPSGGGGGSTPPNPLLANYYCMVINNDEPETTSRLVTLNFSTDATVTKVVVSNNSDFSNSREFTNYTGDVENWDLCMGSNCPAGNYTVYAKFYSSTTTGEQVSGTLSDDINYVVVDTTRPPVVNFTTSSSTALKTDSSTAVEVKLSYATTVPVTVNYVVSGGATGSGTVTFPANTQTTNIVVNDIADPALETQKTIDVVLSNPVNSVLGTPDVHGIIIYGNGTITEIPPATTTLAVMLEVSLDGQTWVPILQDVPTGTPVSLKASVSGTATGEIFYQFFCEADGTISRQVTNNIDKMVVANLCAYGASGVYLPQVVVLRGGRIASAAAEVMVGDFTPSVQPTFCELHPSSPQCVSYCAQNPSDINCICILNPSDPFCNLVERKTYCELNPNDPGCSYCAQNPTEPACLEVDPAFCILHPSDPACIAIDPFTFCQLNPSDPTCIATRPLCETNPADPVCQKPFCVENPSDPACTVCAQHPTTPECICAYILTDPSCTKIEPNYCEQFPTDPRCSACAQNPTLPGCVVNPSEEKNPTETLILTVQGWAEMLRGPAASPLNQALTGSFAFLGAPIITAAQYAILTPGLTSLTEILLILLQLLQSLLAFLGIRKKRNHWGTVYDAATKQPLDPAIVELVDEKTGKVVEQSITDMTGRFGFLLREGEFKIRSTKTHFVFPSQHILGKEDEVFDQLYHGEGFMLNKNNSTVVAPNIPMDPLDFDWNQKDKQRVVKFHPWREVAVRWFFNTLFYIGLVWTMFTVLVSPSWFNYICLAFYIVVLLVQWLMPRERLWGRVYDDETNLLIPWVILEISSPELKVVLGRAKSGVDGRFFMKAEPGIYQLSAYRKSEDGSRELLGTGRVTVGKNRILNADVSINLS